MRRFSEISYKTIIKYCIYFVLMILTARADTTNGLQPFGLGTYVALIYARQNMIILAPMYLLANLLNSFTWQSAIIGITPTVIFTVAYFIHHKLNKRMGIAACNIYTLLSQIPYIIFKVLNGFEYGTVINVLIGQMYAYIAIIALYAIIVRGLRFKLTIDENISLLVFIGVVSLSLYNISFGNFNLFFLFYGFALLAVAFCSNGVAPIYLSVVSGLGCAFAGGGIESIAVCVLLGTAVCAFRNVNAPVAAAAMVFTDAALAFYFNAYGGYGYLNIIILAAGAILFLLLPSRYKQYSLGDITGSYARAGKTVVNKNRMEMSLRLYSLANIFEDMQVLLKGNGGALTDASVSREVLAKDIAVTFCGKCENRDVCFSSLGNDTSAILENVLEASERKGKATIIDMPPFITSRCRRLNGLIQNINEKIEAAKQLADDKDATDRGRQMLSTQMGGVAEILDNLAYEFKRPVSFDGAREKLIIDELTYRNINCKEVMVYGEGGDINISILVKECDADKAVLIKTVSHVMKIKLARTGILAASDGYVSIHLAPAPRYDFVYGEAFLKKKGEEVTGDARCVKKISSNKAIFAVSDGMGSGKAAESMGNRAALMIENFFEAGFSSDVAMALSNRLLSLNDGEDFSALDLMVLDLNTGAADFIKLGATYTVIKHGENADVLSGHALPAGILENAKPYICRKILINNDMVILMSDGITDAIPQSELTEFLSNYRSTNPQALADEIITMAATRGNDDMTVMVIRLFSGM